MNLNLKKLKIAQARACLSINDLSNKSGLGKATISKIINGVSNPSARSVGLLAKALNIDVEQIIDIK
jgi:transcriptional regulator with XRE-family HTH domain